MGAMEIKDLVTGATGDRSKEAAGKGRSMKKVREEMTSLFLRVLAGTEKPELAGKCSHHHGAYRSPGRGPWEAAAVTWQVSGQGASGGLDDILKMHFFPHIYRLML